MVSAISVRDGRAFENIGAEHPSEDCPIALVPRGGLDLPKGAAVVSNSFAFGGNNCSLVFRAASEVS